MSRRKAKAQPTSIADAVGQQLRRAMSKPDPKLPPRRLRREQQLDVARKLRDSRRATY